MQPAPGYSTARSGKKPLSAPQIFGLNLNYDENLIKILSPIDLITVSEAILKLTGRQTCLKITAFSLYANPMSNNFHKTSLLKNS